MIVKPEIFIAVTVLVAAVSAGVYWLIKSWRPSLQELREDIEWPPPPPLPPPSLPSRLSELGRLFNILFDFVGSRTVIIGKLHLIYNDKGVSIRVQDPRLPAPNMEIAFFDEESQHMSFYFYDAPLEKQNKIVDWIRDLVESEIEKRKIELDNALTIIASITEEGPEAEPTNTME